MFSEAVSGVIVARYSSVLEEHDTLKQFGHKQSMACDGVKNRGEIMTPTLSPFWRIATIEGRCAG
ncbi:hypothetical protein FPK15_contig00019-0032 [Flavobacterium psychrophilum]|uniref:hypothetical protein n=1 Tax=Flavobacterium psychrophilum TaxID=96345 RepID=UPI00073E2633|nr:hypothetical protein [Flavobacterium psychrophilum]GAQ48856.1 hypothetical protein FPK15_contig00019-0032 [Flavobacterium psychrophilum]GAW89361.1 hypothetical protein FPS14_contig00020-0021 [Flavobacterium psychrophilum]